jgi:hypothetical protein
MIISKTWMAHMDAATMTTIPAGRSAGGQIRAAGGDFAGV